MIDPIHLIRLFEKERGRKLTAANVGLLVQFCLFVTEESGQGGLFDAKATPNVEAKK